MNEACETLQDKAEDRTVSLNYNQTESKSKFPISSATIAKLAVWNCLYFSINQRLTGHSWTLIINL